MVSSRWRPSLSDCSAVVHERRPCSDRDPSFASKNRDLWSAAVLCHCHLRGRWRTWEDRMSKSSISRLCYLPGHVHLDQCRLTAFRLSVLFRIGFSWRFDTVLRLLIVHRIEDQITILWHDASAGFNVREQFLNAFPIGWPRDSSHTCFSRLRIASLTVENRREHLHYRWSRISLRRSQRSNKCRWRRHRWNCHRWKPCDNPSTDYWRQRWRSPKLPLWHEESCERPASNCYVRLVRGARDDRIEVVSSLPVSWSPGLWLRLSTASYLVMLDGELEFFVILSDSIAYRVPSAKLTTWLPSERKTITTLSSRWITC